MIYIISFVTLIISQILLKNIGNGIGAIAVTPAVVSLFQSCQTSATYNPLFIPKDDFKIISNLMEMIIPKTDIPGADR